MEGGKKIIAIVVLLALVVAAVVFGVKKSDIGGKKLPQWVKDQEVTKIDTETGDLITRTFGEWEALGHDKARIFKNPNTKKYTMADPIPCAACGETIPPLKALLQIDATASGDAESRIAAAKKKFKLMSEYMCPQCGEPAYLEEQMMLVAP